MLTALVRRDPNVIELAKWDRPAVLGELPGRDNLESRVSRVVVTVRNTGTIPLHQQK